MFNSDCLSAAVAAAAAAASVNGTGQKTTQYGVNFNQYPPASMANCSASPSSTPNSSSSPLAPNSQQLIEMASKHLPSLQSPLNRLIMMIDEKNSTISSSS